MKNAIILLCFLQINTAFSQSRIYVNQFAVGAGSGQSWTDAYPDLQNALSAAEAGDTVWVAEGIYYPTTTTDRAISFEPRSGVRLFGGFSGSENSLNQRDLQTHPTILSGDIGLAGDSTDNSYNVMYLFQPDSNTVIDGLVLRNGLANNTADASGTRHRLVCGGGLYIMGEGWEAYPEIRNCRFEQNSARYFGGGVMVNGASGGSTAPRFYNCVFEANRALSNGGGLYKYGASEVERGVDLDSCVFIRNSAVTRGGGLFYVDSDGQDSIGFQDCIFEKNEAGIAGGGCGFFLGRAGKSHFSMQKTIFNANASDAGAAVYWFANGFNDFDGKIDVDSSTFESNISYGSTGSIVYNALIAIHQSEIRFVANIFEENNTSALILDISFEGDESSGLIEGAIFKNNHKSDPLIISIIQVATLERFILKNSAFIHNEQSRSQYGDINKVHYVNCTFDDSIPSAPAFVNTLIDSIKLENCTFYTKYNSILNGSSKNLFVRNSFIRPTTTNFFYNPNCKTYLSNCFLPGFDCAAQNPNVLCEGGIITAGDPMFVDSAQGDFRLLPCSPLVNAGSNAFVTSATDVAGNPRIQGGTVDIGAYETPAPNLAADPLASPACPGAANGSVALQLENGCQPYQLAWSGNGLEGLGTDSLEAGAYTFTVTDGRGSSFTLDVTIPEGTTLALEPFSAPVVCGDTLGGSAWAAVSGGPAPFSFEWTGGTDSILTNLAPGTYALTVTDARRCTATTTVEVGKTGSLDVDIEATEISCYGAADGSFTVIPLDGKPPFQWNWENGPMSSAYGPLGPGTYQGTLTDAFGCSILWILPLSQPDSLHWEATVTPASDSINGNGSIQLGPISGGTQPYTATWSNGQSGFVIDALPPGTYTLTLIDANGCGRVAAYVVPFTTGTREIGHGPVLYLFPNPADQAIFIRSDQAGPARIIVYNALGQMIVQQQSARLNTDMDCRDWPAGMYYVSVQVGGKNVFNGKFAVRH